MHSDALEVCFSTIFIGAPTLLKALFEVLASGYIYQTSI